MTAAGLESVGLTQGVDRQSGLILLWLLDGYPSHVKEVSFGHSRKM